MHKVLTIKIGMNLTSRYSEINKENIYLSLWDMKKPFIFAVPFGKVVVRIEWNGEQKKKFIDRLDKST